MKKAISNQGVKRAGSPIVGGSRRGAKKRFREKVVILEDSWLEALKHLTCSEWSKMRLVTRKLNGLVGRNVSRLPLGIIDRAEIKYVCNRYKLRINEHSWNNRMAQFLQLIYHPATFTREIQINLWQRELKSTFSANVMRHIRCGKFILTINVDLINDLREYISWIEQNVRADQIHFCDISVYQFNDQARVQALNILSDFAFGSSQLCANEKTKFELEYSSARFLNILISKFRSISVIDSRIPTIVIYPHPCAEIYRDHLGPNLIDRENDNPPNTEAVYLISNENNRMRISFCKSAQTRAGQRPKFDVYVKFYTV